MSTPPPRAPRLGGYVLTERIGQGGMAVVYKATREGWSGFEKVVVVKAMQPELAHNQEFVDLFIAEAKISAQLSHPGIVQVHDFGVYQGTPYLVMDYLNGINLQQLQAALASANRRMPVPMALVIITEICHALGYAHAFKAPDGTRRQIIHSDVSPANVMVCRDGAVKLLDFGVAKVIDEADYDMSLKPKGKFAYMSPEQVDRLPTDRRVDVFAAGIMLHELLSGQRLFVGSDEQDTLRNVLHLPIPPPSRINPEVSTGLDAVVLKALARDPSRRFDSGRDMAAALEAVERVGGGKRRIAEFLYDMFPREWAVRCANCTKPVVPGLTCKDCGTLAPLEGTMHGDGTQPVEAPLLPLAGEIHVPDPADFAGEPVPAPPENTLARRRSGLKTATVAFGLIGAVMGVGSSGRARSWLKGVARNSTALTPTAAVAIEGTPTRHELPAPNEEVPETTPVTPPPVVEELERDIVVGAGSRTAETLDDLAAIAPPREPLPKKRRHPARHKLAPPRPRFAGEVVVKSGNIEARIKIPAFARPKKP